MPETTIVVCPEEETPEAALMAASVGGLSGLLRIVLTARRAGMGRILVVASALQQTDLRPLVEADGRLRGCVTWREPGEPCPSSGPCLILTPSLVLDPDGLAAWCGEAAAAVVAAPDPSGLGPLVLPATLCAEAMRAARAGPAGLRAFLGQVAADGRLALIPWRGRVRRLVRDPSEIPALERDMLRALRTPEDGPIVDRFVNRTVSGWLSRRLVRWPVTPNQITVASLFTGLAGAWLLGYEGMPLALAGLLLFQLSVVLDHADGEVARLTFQYSRLGKWLDNWSDHAVDLAVIACLAWRVAAAGTGGHGIALGLAAVLGVTGSFLVVFWWSLSGRPPRVRWRVPPARWLARALGTSANRDGFCLALWATVLLGRPVWFLWALAVGANAYWLAWLMAYGLPRGGRHAPDPLPEG